MKKLFIPVLFLICLNQVYSQNVDFEWAKMMNGQDNTGTGIEVDEIGNVYTIGYYEGLTDFDPGASTDFHTSNAYDFYIQKLDPSGNLIWVKTIGGVSSDFVNSIYLDAGNLYLVGTFSDTVDFNPSANQNILTSDNQDFFVMKLDTSGNFIWAKKGHSTRNASANKIKGDQLGNIYITGKFQDTLSFANNIGVNNLVADSTLNNMFIAKYSPNGNVMWTKSVGGTSSSVGNSLAIDTMGFLYVTGAFKDTIDVNPDSNTHYLISSGDYDVFIQKLDTSGNFIWGKSIGGIGFDYSYDIDVDSDGNIYTAGIFIDTVDFNPGVDTLNVSSSFGYDGFTLKLNSAGDFNWIRKTGNAYFDYISAITIDNENYIYIAGYFNDTSDYFIEKLDTAGNLVWLINEDQKGGLSVISDINVDENGSIYSTGWLLGRVDFNPENDTFYLGSNNAGIVTFIQKLSKDTTVGLIPLHAPNQEFKLYPNPNNGNFTIEFKEIQDNIHLKLFSILGQEIETKKISQSNLIQFEIKQPSGIYLLKLYDLNGHEFVYKVIKS